MIGDKRRLRGRQVVEVPRRQAAAAQQLPRVPGQVVPGDDAVEIGHHAAHRPAHVASAALEGKEADRPAVVLEHADLDAAADRGHGQGELGAEIGAGQGGLRPLDFGPSRQLGGRQGVGG